jgi:hypothetical protein
MKSSGTKNTVLDFFFLYPVDAVMDRVAGGGMPKDASRRLEAVGA